MKTCNRCQIEKPDEAFWKNSASPDGLRGTCSECETTSRGTGTGSTIPGQPIKTGYLSGKSAIPTTSVPFYELEGVEEFVLELSKEMKMTPTVHICPVCDAHNYLFYATLEGAKSAGKSVIAVCNGCLLEVPFKLKFFGTNNRMFITKELDHYI